MKRPLPIWLLLFSLLFLAFGGLYGGIAMLIDPAGSTLQMDAVLPLLPVPDYTLPGLFLLFIMGLTPLILIYALLTRPGWSWVEAAFRWSGHHWAWTGSLTLGVLLVIWLAIQGLLIDLQWAIQFVTAGNAIMILLFALLPSVRRHYARDM
ncbi:MAG TPA: hypothetical protein VLA49_09580 [Anaerolineales bacterium]|nr:hypothetical protein [Anaerolineales bacterium]